MSNTQKWRRTLVELGAAYGACLVERSGKHWKLKGDGWFVTVSHSPRNADQAVKQIKSELARAARAS